MNKTMWDKLPKDNKAHLYHWSQQLWNLSETIRSFDDESATALKEMTAKGVKSHQLPAAEYERMVKASAPVTKKWIESMTAKGEPAQQFVDDMRAAAAKWKGRNFDRITQRVLDAPLPGIADF